ncbi:hypothetical protein ACI68E_001768 [Malassezia pachydermatis]
MQYFVLPALVTATGMLVNAAPVANTGMTGFQPLAPASTRPGEQMAVQWSPDLSGSQEWKHMDISLVSVSKNGKHHVTKLASNVDGTNPNNNMYTATAPAHMRNDNVYYIQFSHGNSKLNSPQFFIENPDSSFSKLHARSGASAQTSDTPGAVPDESLYPNGNSDSTSGGLDSLGGSSSTDSTEGSDSADSSSGNGNLLNTMVQQGSAAMDHISQVFQQAAGQSNGDSGSGSDSAMPSLSLSPQAGMPLTIDGVTYVPVPPLVLNQLTSNNGSNSTGSSSGNRDSSDSSGNSGSLSDRLQNAINVGGVTYVPVPREVAEQLMNGNSNSTSTHTNSRESTRGRNSENALDTNDAQDASSVADLIGQNILSQSALPTDASAMTSILSSMQQEGATSVDDVSSTSRSHSSSRHHHQSPSSTSSHPRSSSSHARPTSSSSSHSRHHSSSSSSSALPTSSVDASSALSSATVSSTEAVPTSTAGAATDSDTFHNAMAATATGDAGSMAGLSRRADGPFNHAISRIAQAANSASLDPSSFTMATGSSSNATSATGSGSSSDSASSTSSPSSHHHHHSHSHNSTSTSTSTGASTDSASASSSATRSSHHHGSSSTAVPSSVVESMASSLSINPERASSLLRSLGRSDNDVSDSVSYYLGMDPLAGYGDSSETATSSSNAVPTSTASGSMTRMRQSSSADSSSNTRTRSRSSQASNTGSSSASSGRGGNSRSSSRSAAGDSSDSVMQVLAQGILGNSGLSSNQIDQYYSEMNAQPTGTSNSRGSGNGQMGASLHYSSAAASMSEAY